VFFFLGWNLAGAIGSAVHGLEHFLGHPLTFLAGRATLAGPPT